MVLIWVSDTFSNIFYLWYMYQWTIHSYFFPFEPKRSSKTRASQDLLRVYINLEFFSYSAVFDKVLDDVLRAYVQRNFFFSYRAVGLIKFHLSDDRFGLERPTAVMVCSSKMLRGQKESFGQFIRSSRCNKHLFLYVLTLVYNETWSMFGEMYVWQLSIDKKHRQPTIK